MNTFTRSIFSFLFALVLAASAFGQINTLTQTSLSAAVTSTSTTVTLASVTNVSVTTATGNGAVLYIVDPGQTRGELAQITSVNTTTLVVGLRRSGNVSAHVSGAMVLVGAPNLFYSSNPQGSCTTATILVTPYVNTVTGQQWLCSTITLSWVPGWQNQGVPPGSTATVASAAGAILPSGPLFKVSGTAAVTGFTVPVGFQSGSFTVIPTGAFTWTTAGNIGLAGTAVVGRAITFIWDAVASKFYPSYV